MMGPQPLLNTWLPTLKFDVVVMDEATQIRPEDAIGASGERGPGLLLNPCNFRQEFSTGSLRRW
jgi:hypothetical protein